ncbi:BZ3500_MvSof-1268-A1-R1_Chr3-3g06617 [Microbotryum saponariae]|uniref:BZ3500_MvSof-1268-A1-R1_Chr3-3g06617 protein n=1 Tax=Microbotryum saponariae TaxID=289078 RepID=A0A2X0LC88_9BASI|nr:BZ3500_MvSof-1268-A1-R1_Chr3-3g06617 [Microbotryum saponariae]SDA04584.1 BZ3501_MvSof-1269-A2-R1_Chr3-2g06304 [Microbotryum saponariae]
MVKRRGGAAREGKREAGWLEVVVRRKRSGALHFSSVFRPIYVGNFQIPNAKFSRPPALRWAFRFRLQHDLQRAEGCAYANDPLPCVTGHRQLSEYGFIHRDVSYGNGMVHRHGDGVLIDYNLAVRTARTIEETCRLSRSERSRGTLPYISRLLLVPETESVVHGRWHDIESLLYVASRTAFQSGSRIGFKTLLAACASRWSGVEDVLTILKDNCSIAAAYVDLDGDELEAKLCDLWDTGVMSYKNIQTRLRALAEAA